MHTNKWTKENLLKDGLGSIWASFIVKCYCVWNVTLKNRKVVDQCKWLCLMDMYIWVIYNIFFCSSGVLSSKQISSIIVLAPLWSFSGSDIRRKKKICSWLDTCVRTWQEQVLNSIMPWETQENCDRVIHI